MRQNEATDFARSGDRCRNDVDLNSKGDLSVPGERGVDQDGVDRARCLECRRVWLTKAPWSYERAKNFCMPYGKHEGRRLSDLAETDGGLGYLRWLAANVKGNVGIAARIMLDDVDLKRMSK